MKLHQYRLGTTNPYHYNSLKDDIIEWATFYGLHLIIGHVLMYAVLELMYVKVVKFIRKKRGLIK